MLKILGKASSINVRKVLWTCQELGLDFEREDFGSGFQPTDTPQFKALNPNAMVPVLIDGDFVLWESNVICRYLVAKEGRSDLLSTDPQTRALTEQWMDWQAGDLNNSWRYAFPALARNSPQHTDRTLIDAGVSDWNRHVQMIEEQLHRSGDYILGNSFTLADVPIGLAVNRWSMTPMSRPALPAVTAYYERLNQREGFRLFGRNGTA
ncbi:MAG: glutathione S-transferase family protein [Ewingella sp.]